MGYGPLALKVMNTLTQRAFHIPGSFLLNPSLIDIHALCLQIPPCQLNLGHQLLMRLGYIVECEDAVAELEQQVCAKGHKRPEWKDRDDFGLEKGWKRHKMQVQGEVELYGFISFVLEPSTGYALRGHAGGKKGLPRRREGQGRWFAELWSLLRMIMVLVYRLVCSVQRRVGWLCVAMGGGCAWAVRTALRYREA